MTYIVLNTADFMVLNKPSGMPMHDSSSAIIPFAQAAFNYPKLWLVHRLDTGTSGCIILAKTKIAAAELSAQFANKKIQKYYLALIDRKPKKKQGLILGNMQKARNGDWKLSTKTDNPAITQFFSYALMPKTRQMEALSLPASSNVPALQKTSQQQASKRLCVVKPTSGKTHQIRVALKSLGSPIIGDERYKGTSSDRLYLHSYAIQFDFQGKAFNATCLPQSGEFFTNKDLEYWLEENQEPWSMKWPSCKI
ncbi:MAG: tRNA pseudouridine32 synthase/23S rRNA pseudouridine746 synthase [Glaciecola sp.]|jgi:tRNA pseudouridine32 synthase/23S rRNA pseudouridine746 synthase